MNPFFYFQQYKGHTISWPPTVIVVWVLFATTTIFRKHTSLFLGKIRLLSFQDFVFLATNWAIHATFPAHRCKIDPEVEKAKRVEELNQLKYGSQEKVSFWCRCSIFSSLTFVEIKKSFTKMFLSFNFKNFRIFFFLEENR